LIFLKIDLYELRNNFATLLNLPFGDSERWGDAEGGGIKDKRVSDDAVLG
jgi:hypothetical protein